MKKLLAWFYSKQRLIDELVQVAELLEAERAKVEAVKRDYEEYRDDHDRWQAEHEVTQQNKELREALRLAEEDNDRLYRIIAALRIERGSVG